MTELGGVAPGRWRMWTHRYDDGDLRNLGSRRYVEFHGVPKPIVEVDVAEVAADNPAATHWGWIFTGKTEPVMIYPREVLFRVCFPYGVQAEVDAGKGRVVRLAVTEVDDYVRKNKSHRGAIRQGRQPHALPGIHLGLQRSCPG